MNSFLYTIGIYFLGLGMKIASLFHPKAKLWVKGRKNIFSDIRDKIGTHDKVIWMHASSLGEYEQGLPVLAALKEKFPDHKFAVSFFSPSGYEIIKNKSWADLLFYIPLDTPSNAKKLVKILHPEYAVFVKYDFWYNILRELSENKIQTLFISAVFRKNHIYFKPRGRWFVSVLKKVSHFFVQDERSKKLLESVGIGQVTVSGDTRFDRVKMLPEQDNHLDWLAGFKNGKVLFVAGSTWKKDDELIKNFINSPLLGSTRILIAPHNMNPEYFQKLKTEFKPKTLLFSEKENKNPEEYQIFILDTIGLLTRVYSYADIAYVGGAFGKKGIHNILEPAVFGIPILYGPVYDNFIEAEELAESGGALVVHDQQEFDL
ncbi:MAG: 3-deoxy-D-manno-octulosonic acid transferase, partial [Flavobacteriaceae bacterium]|nr:3-deoxy-D-manno-octulosonic acid transferase [Flavobacteriaceae bacterium]